METSRVSPVLHQEKDTEETEPPVAFSRPRFLSIQPNHLPNGRPRSGSSNSPLETICEKEADSFESIPGDLTSRGVRSTSLDSPLAPTLKKIRQRLKPNRPDQQNSRLSESFRHSLGTALMLKGRLGGSRRIRNRLVQKHGDCNLSLVNVPKQGRKYFSDIFTTLVDVKWRWCLLVFSMGFLLSWLLFSILYYLVVLSHGDLQHTADAEWTPCIQNVKGFASIFIFSVVSQHTIGYGFRYPTEKCPEVLFLICIQAMVGVMIQTLMAGVVFAKIARPKKRAETLIFSKNAVICMRDTQLVFLFRLGDMRKSQLAEAHIRLQMIRKRITDEGELLPFHQFDMDVGYDDGLDRLFIVWPITICHVIDEDSPLYDISAEDLANSRFEIVVILEGVVESTGATTQARTSYIPSEVLWGHRFEKLVTYQRDNGEYRIDFGRFHNTYPIQMPSFSAKQLDEMREVGMRPEEAYQSDLVENMGATPYSTIHNQPPDTIRPSIIPLLERKLRIQAMEEGISVPSVGGISGIDEDSDVDESPLISGIGAGGPQNGGVTSRKRNIVGPQPNSAADISATADGRTRSAGQDPFRRHHSIDTTYLSNYSDGRNVSPLPQITINTDSPTGSMRSRSSKSPMATPAALKANNKPGSAIELAKMKRSPGSVPMVERQISQPKKKILREHDIM